MACAPASSWHSLYAILPASRDGKTSTLASPACTPFFPAITGLRAASACTGPAKPVACAAARTLSTDGPVPLSPVEYDNSATRAGPSKAAQDRAEARAISAKTPASGSVFTAQSAKIISAPSRNRITKKDDGAETSGASPTARPAASITRRVGLSAPATMACTSPMARLDAALIKGFFNIRVANTGAMPRRAVRSDTIASLTSGKGTGTQRSCDFRTATACATRGSSHSGKTTRRPRPLICSDARSTTDILSPFSRNRSPS